MSITTITDVGEFTTTAKDGINANFVELYSNKTTQDAQIASLQASVASAFNRRFSAWPVRASSMTRNGWRNFVSQVSGDRTSVELPG